MLETKRDYRVTYIRTVSTILVVFIHIIQRLSNTGYPKLSFISDWFNLGLVMFFVMSAFLYSNRTIKKGTEFKWILKRYAELIIPAFFTVTVADILYQMIFGGITITNILYSIMAGLGFESLMTYKWIYMQYWFLTYILICYITIPILQKINFKSMKNLAFWGLIVIVTIFMQGTLSVLNRIITMIAIPVWGGLLRFYMSYAIFKRYDINSSECKSVMRVLSAICIPLIVGVCIFRYYLNIEGVWASLQEIMFIYTQTLSGIVLFYWLYKLFATIEESEMIISLTDKYSYPVYLTHSLFIGYSTSVLDRFSGWGKIVGIIIALILTAVFSEVVYRITTPIKKKVVKSIGKI